MVVPDSSAEEREADSLRGIACSHCELRSPRTILAAPDGRGWGWTEDEEKSKDRFPEGRPTRKALHAATASFARHERFWPLPMVADGDGLRTRRKAKTTAEADSLRGIACSHCELRSPRTILAAPDGHGWGWTEDEEKSKGNGKSRFPSGMTTRKATAKATAKAKTTAEAKTKAKAKANANAKATATIKATAIEETKWFSTT